MFGSLICCRVEQLENLKNSTVGYGPPLFAIFRMLSQILLFKMVYCILSVRYYFTSNSFDTTVAQFSVQNACIQTHTHKIHKCKWQTIVLVFGEKVGQYCGIDYSTWEDLLLLLFSLALCFVLHCMYMCDYKCRARHE